MAKSPDGPDERPVATLAAASAAGGRPRASVSEQVEAMRALLVRLLQDVARAEARLERSDAESGAQTPIAAIDPPAPISPAPTGAAAVPGGSLRTVADLRGANERLVLSALDAQHLAEAAEQARQRQTALLDAVADELRDPQAPIRIATRMLGLPGSDEPLLPRVKTLVDQQMRRVAHLVEAVGARSTGLPFERVRVDMVGVVDAAIASQRPMLERKGQQLDWQRPEVRFEAVGDAAALELAVGNLLDNASRFAPEGGRIGLALVRHRQALTLSVTDDGIGIAPSMLQLVFEPFAQDPRVLGFDGIGPGVGLTVARALLRALGGDLVADSAGLDRGSRFELTLPLAPVPAAPGGAG